MGRRAFIGVRQRVHFAAGILEKVRLGDPRDLRRIGNVLRCLASRRRSRIRGGPFFAQVEPTTLCNLRCRFCLNSSLPRPRHSLSCDQFARVLDALPGLLAVNLQGCGEPTLNPELLRMASEARRRRIWVSTVTNLNLDEEMVGRLAESDFDAIHVSLESADPERYEWYRRGGSFPRFVRNLRLLTDHRQKLRGHFAGAFWVTVTTETLDGLEGIFRLAEETGAVRRVQVQLLQSKDNYVRVYDDEMRARSFLDLEGQETRVRGLLRVHSRRSGVTGWLVGGRCGWPWGGIFVNAEGHLAPCCAIKDFQDPGWGEIADLEGAWHSAEWVGVREGLLAGRPHPACRSCPAARAGGHARRERGATA
jgi:MoaA/NifB/PqqE/SkfB family radical SAM enzyme